MKGIAILFLIFVVSSSASAQIQDSVRMYWMKPVEVTGVRLGLGDVNLPSETDNLRHILDQNGFALIRKGVFFAQDIYADGFKRGDITVVIDGERYHSACPNRMDSPLTRVNTLDLASVDLVKSGGHLQSGLGGVVAFHRRKPSSSWLLNGALTGSAAASEAVDASLSIDGHGNSLTARYAKGLPYSNGNGASFTDLYGYRDNYRYSLAEAAFHGMADEWAYGTSFSYTEDVSFPYLLMDEIYNRVYSAHTDWNGNRVYFNYTDHFMTNELRVSMSSMETAAKNLTAGVVGDYYEMYYRSWDSDNIIETPKETIKNDLMPGVQQYYGALTLEKDTANFSVKLKAGASYSQSDEVMGRWDMIMGANMSYFNALTSTLGLGIMGEFSSASPEMETYYIQVEKPTGKANWYGNENLKQPWQATFRTALSWERFRLEVYATSVWNYVELWATTDGRRWPGRDILTYGNVDVYLAGINLSADGRYYRFDGSWTWGEYTRDHGAMAEIPPLRLSLTLMSPEWSGLTSFLRTTWNTAQNRVNADLSEIPTPDWLRMDLGLKYSWDRLIVRLEVDNIFDRNYRQHLSYLRNPFSSGMHVWDRAEYCDSI